eukprot:Selendium_serpulae@DN6159_c1_g1_i1.p1
MTKSEDASLVPLDGILTDRQVAVHPIVLLSVVDHYTRVVKGGDKRVVGTLLGEYSDGKTHITNCFGLPFEEDSKDSTVWFLDHNFHEQMFYMFKKINAKERVVGWYSTGPKIKPADLEIHEVFRRYTPQPVYVIVDVQPKDHAGLPTDAYLSFEEPKYDGAFRRTFVHIPSTIEAYTAEEVGVEHLLRDLKSLISKLQEIAKYLEAVIEGTLPPNPKLLYNFQNIFNMLPDLDREDIISSFRLQTNDTMLALYLGSLVRSVIALHNVINNKLDNKLKAEAKTTQSATPMNRLI